MEEMTELEETRAARADDLYGGACRECGIPVHSWQDFEGWQEYVDGGLAESELVDKAQNELKEYARRFGKYLMVAPPDPKALEQETEKRARAKRASRIYRELCDEAGLTACFFRDFSSWSDFVKGRIGEPEFQARAKHELERMQDELK
ncbi:MAG: hypothetical protein HXY24_11650 [Rubrivivax sp.]|nr:hypothetical protein [Rubrivivax sp.]